MSALAQARALRRRRETVIVAVLCALVLVLVLASMTIGAASVSLPSVIQTLFGFGDRTSELVVFQLRLPRIVMAVIVGIAFAVAGGLFQMLLGNPLASPDIIGITGGASAAAVTGILVLGLSGVLVSVMAFAGALGVAAIIYALSWRSGIAGYRFVLIGIACAFFVQGVIGLLLTRADVRDAQTALVWLVGSLNGVRWPAILVAALGLLVLLPLVAVVAPRLRILQLGDDTASGLGLDPQRTRLGILAIAVALAAVGTAAVGPLAFVAFVSAPIARRLTRTGGLALVPSALVGVLLVLASDLIAQHALPGGIRVPAGIITGAVGAPYLLWLLARSNRRRGEL